jgi:hypothetical protein
MRQAPSTPTRASRRAAPYAPAQAVANSFWISNAAYDPNVPPSVDVAESLRAWSDTFPTVRQLNDSTFSVRSSLSYGEVESFLMTLNEFLEQRNVVGVNLVVLQE